MSEEKIITAKELDAVINQANGIFWSINQRITKLENRIKELEKEKE